MAAPVFRKIRRKIARFLNLIFCVEIGYPPANLAESVADRLLDGLTPRERSVLRRRFGVDPETDLSLEEAHAHFSATRERVREIEAMALIRLYRWEDRKPRSPAVQRRLARRVAAAHGTILEALCDTLPVRGLLVDWHDALVSAGECGFARLPEPAVDDDAVGPPAPPTLALARTLRKALWAHTRARRAARGDAREEERATVLATLHEARLSARGIAELAERVLGLARRIHVEDDEQIPQLLDPVADPDAPARPCVDEPPAGEPPDLADRDPGLAAALEAEAGMPVEELWRLAETLQAGLDRAGTAIRLLADAGMPAVAEIVDATGARGSQFVAGLEIGRAALLRAADGFCYLGDEDYFVWAEKAVRRALLGAGD